MPIKPSKTLAIIERRRKVADMYLQHWTQTQIAEHLGVGQPTICEDLKHVREEWRNSAVRDFDLARQFELAKIDRIERESWAAWVSTIRSVAKRGMSSTGSDAWTKSDCPIRSPAR